MSSKNLSNKIVLITGCARSRTSMVAGLLDSIGFWGGETFGPDRNNRSGYFENKLLREKISKPLLEQLGADPLGQRSFPNLALVHKKAKDYQFISKLRSQWYKCMDRQGWNGEQAWYYKGAKLCLAWPIWNEVFPDAHWIIVRRSVNAIADSCLRTSFMRAYSTKEDWQKWISYHLSRFVEMKDHGLNVWNFWPEELLDGNFSHFQRLTDWLGIERDFYDMNKIKAFVNPSITKR